RSRPRGTRSGDTRGPRREGVDEGDRHDLPRATNQHAGGSPMTVLVARRTWCGPPLRPRAQRMEYELKLGPVGKLMDAIMVRKKWDAGIKGFFAGLKHYVETGRRPSANA